jgi:hypothetical protein
MSSLSILKDSKQGHMCKSSFASTLGSAEDRTEPDHVHLGQALLVPGMYSGQDRSHSAASDRDALSWRTSITSATSPSPNGKSRDYSKNPAGPETNNNGGDGAASAANVKKGKTASGAATDANGDEPESGARV